jgi:hypothetical protein
MLQIPVSAPKNLNMETKSNVSKDASGLNRSVLQIYRQNVFGRESLKSYQNQHED